MYQKRHFHKVTSERQHDTVRRGSRWELGAPRELPYGAFHPFLHSKVRIEMQTWFEFIGLESLEATL